MKNNTTETPPTIPFPGPASATASATASANGGPPTEPTPEMMEQVRAGTMNSIAFNRALIWAGFQTAIFKGLTGGDKAQLNKLVENFKTWREAEGIGDILAPAQAEKKRGFFG